MRHQRQRLSRRLHPGAGATCRDQHFVDCQLDGSSIAGHGQTLEEYPSYRDCSLTRCRLSSCNVHAVRFADCALRDCTWNGLLVLEACVFTHVVLEGKLGELNIVPGALDQRVVYRDLDWALDIRKAGSRCLGIMGVPARLIKRDPRVHGVITRARVAAVPAWKKIVGRSMAGLVIADLLDDDTAEDVVYVAHPGARHQKYLDELAMLRANGLAE